MDFLRLKGKIGILSRARVCSLDLLFVMFSKAPTEFPLVYRVKLPIKSMSYGIYLYSRWNSGERFEPISTGVPHPIFLAWSRDERRVSGDFRGCGETSSLPIRIDECKHCCEFLREIFAALHHRACWQQICFALCHLPREKCPRYIRVPARACRGKNGIYSRRECLPSSSTDSYSSPVQEFPSAVQNARGCAISRLRGLCF